MSVNPTETTVVAPGMEPVASTAPAPGSHSALFQKAGGDWDKANKSYFDLVSELQRVQGQAQQVVEQNQRLAFALTGRQDSQAVDDNPWSAVQNELGLPADTLRKASRAEVMTAVEELFGPVLREAQAIETLSGEIENFDAFKAKAQQYMRKNPEVKEVFDAVKQHDPVKGWRYAIREALIAEGGRPPGPPNVAGAGLPSGMNAGGRIAPTGEVSQPVREAEALKYAVDYGDNAPYRHERFKGTSVERAIMSALQHLGMAPPQGGGINPGW